MAPGMRHGVGGAALPVLQKTDAKGGMGHQILVPHQHAALILVIGEPQQFIRLLQNPLILFLLRRAPCAALVSAGKHHFQPDSGAVIPAGQHSPCGQRIESQRSAAQEKAVSLLIKFRNQRCQIGLQSFTVCSGDYPVPGEANGLLRVVQQSPGYVSIFSTARKASLGT